MSTPCFLPCPQDIVEVRNVPNDDTDRRTLWRTAFCDPGRWHYLVNPCNCDRRRLTVHSYISRAGWRLDAPRLHTWAQSHGRTNEWLQNEKCRLEAAARIMRAGACAVGPREVLQPKLGDFCPTCGVISTWML